MIQIRDILSSSSSLQTNNIFLNLFQTTPQSIFTMAGDCGCSGASSCNCGSSCTCSGCGK
ncbi:hypothetical protein LB507_008807 [Fusarium sp. FIESC RH6]|nr:hypothetical protein LB507_008807 [Fusarium sp. FIESC RH6]